MPSVLAPSRKLTVPVGVPDPGATAVTLTVSVTGWPNTDGFTDDVTVAVLSQRLPTANIVPPLSV
jgi:hypothetical protein